MQSLIHPLSLVNIGNLTFRFQYCQNMQIKYLSRKRLVSYQLSKSGKTISTSRTGTYCAAWDTSWSSGFYFLFSVWLRQRTGTWFLHVETRNKTISSVQIYSDNLHSRRRNRTSLHFGSPWTHYLQTPLDLQLSTCNNSGRSPFLTSKHTKTFSFHCTDEL